MSGQPTPVGDISDSGSSSGYGRSGGFPGRGSDTAAGPPSFDFSSFAPTYTKADEGETGGVSASDWGRSLEFYCTENMWLFLIVKLAHGRHIGVILESPRNCGGIARCAGEYLPNCYYYTLSFPFTQSFLRSLRACCFFESG